jgi:hypothetical protein
MRVLRLRTRTRRASTVLAALAVTLAVAPSARADVGEQIILRCTHSQSLAGFKPADYQKALKELEADTEEYSDCVPLIRRAERLAAAAGQSHGSPEAASVAAGAPLQASPAETQAIARAAHVSPGAVELGGTPIRPGVIHASSAFGTLPAPLLATLAFLLVAALTFGANGVRNRIRDRRPD